MDITGAVVERIKTAGYKEGFCIVYCPHTTAGITINEGADPDVAADILDHLDKLIPTGGRYRHLEGNADSHIKSSLVGSSATILIEGGRPALGTWQKIFFCEFDGPRRRRVVIFISPTSEQI